MDLVLLNQYSENVNCGFAGPFDPAKLQEATTAHVLFGLLRGEGPANHNSRLRRTDLARLNP